MQPVSKILGELNKKVLCNQIECDAFTCENTNNWGCCQNECAKLGCHSTISHRAPEF